MELMLDLLREDAEQADANCFGTGGDLFYVGTVAGGAVGERLRFLPVGCWVDWL